MKKIISAVLALSLVPTLCACGGQSSKQAGSAASKTETSAVQTTESPEAASAAAADTSLPPDTEPAATESDGDEELDFYVQAYHFSGVVEISKGDEPVFWRAANAESTYPKPEITIDSLLCVGSVSKQFCATAILQLQEQGKLSTGDPLGKFFPECPYGDRVTLHQMLSMRSGIAEFYDTEYENGCFNEMPVGELSGVVTNDGTVEGNRDTLQKWLFAQPLGFEPGSAFAYTNSNYFLLARITELVSGEKYEDYVRAHILRPLGMDSTGFIDEMLDDPRLAKSPHNPKTVYVGVTMGLGDMISCAADMDKWLRSFAEHTVLTEDSLAEMTANYCTEADGGASYGYGVEPDAAGGLRHTGFFTSYFACSYTVPATGYRFFAVTNDQTDMAGSMTEMCGALIAVSAEA